MYHYLILWPSSVLQVNFPRFYGHSHMTFEPLKNSYQTFQVTLEFKVRHHVALFFYLRLSSGTTQFETFLRGAGRLRGWLVAVLRGE